MKYRINISGIHCNGCKNLIKMSLEDVDFQNISVNVDEKFAEFETKESEQKILEKLDKVFEELNDYRYSGLVLQS